MPTQLLTVPADLIPAIGYIRVSMAREEMISPEIQKAAITSWALRMGRRIIAWIEDPDQTGRNFRRKVMRAIERIEAREAVEILVFRYDRWGRNALESLANIVRVEQAGGQVHSATEPVDAETAIGKYNRINALGLAEMQSNLIGEGWRNAQQNRVSRGLTTGGSRRFGYVRLGRIVDPYAVSDRHRYRRDPQDPLGERYEPDYDSGAADAHVSMYDLYLDDNGFSKVAQWLNSRNIGNAVGSRWSEGGVRAVLDSGFAAGLLRVHDPACRHGHNGKCRQTIWVPGAQPAIVDESDWGRYLAKRAMRASLPPRSRTATYPLTSLVDCGQCGTAMAVNGETYKCGRWKRTKDCAPAFPNRTTVERAVREQLAGWAADIDAITATVKARQAARIPAEADRARLTKALADNDAALQRLAIRAATDTLMPAAAYEGARDELLAARSETEAELGRHEEVQPLADPVAVLPIMVEAVRDWDIIPAARRREMLREVIRHVQVFRVPGAKARTPETTRCVVTPVWEPCDCQRCT